MGWPENEHFVRISPRNVRFLCQADPSAVRVNPWLELAPEELRRALREEAESIADRCRD